MDAASRRMSASDRDDAAADARSGDSAQASSRQRAASYLRAAKHTDDPAERRELRRKAAELIDPPRKARPSGLPRGDKSVR
jgi:hypothetical protein